MSSSKNRKHRKTLTFPTGVMPITARGHQYFYYQTGRNTPNPGPRIRLPDDPHSVEFWTALRQAQGITPTARTDTVNALIDAFEAAWPTLQPPLKPGTQYMYRRNLKIAREAWGELAAYGLEPTHVRVMMDKYAATSPATANGFLVAMQAMNKWARARDHVPRSFVEDLRAFPLKGGHKPWTAAQIAAAQAKLTGTLRQGFMLYYFTGQRGADVVKLGPTHIDDGGFAIHQQKTGRDVWVPILPELAAEMATWPKRPGPFLRTVTGRNYTRLGFWRKLAYRRQDTLFWSDILPASYDKRASPHSAAPKVSIVDGPRG